jgi:hypothetical protein
MTCHCLEVDVNSFVGASELLDCKGEEGVLIRAVFAVVLGEFSSCSRSSGNAVYARSTFAIARACGVWICEVQQITLVFVRYGIIPGELIPTIVSGRRNHHLHAVDQDINLVHPGVRVYEAF